MQRAVWLMLALIALFGALGGVVNALMTDNGFLVPKAEQADGGTTVIRPGFLGNVLIGAVAAVISWGLYGPLSAYFVAGTRQALETNASPEKLGLSLAALVGAMLVGVGGARWLSNEVDKKLLKAAAAQAAGRESSPSAAQQIASASPSQALKVARAMPSRDAP